MNNLKKFNTDRSKWEILMSNDAKGISLTNPKMLKDNESVISVDTAIERLKDDLSIAKGNISWLALHGGGGSGGGGGTTPSGEELSVAIKVNGQDSNSTISIGEDGLQVNIDGISVKYNKPWEISAYVGSTKVYATSVNASNSLFFIPYTNIARALNNHTGRLLISASYTDDSNGVYGQGQWSGSIIDNNITLKCDDVASSLSTLNTSFIKLQYSVGTIGQYTLDLKIQGTNNSIQKTYDISIASTNQQTNSIELSDLFTDDTKWIDVYTVTQTLTNKQDQNITKTVKSSLTLVSNNIMISTNVMSKDQSKPVEVNMDGSLYLEFTPYVSQLTSFNYDVFVDDVQVRTNQPGIFAQTVKDYISVSNKSFAVKDKVSKVRVVVKAGDKTAEAAYYIKFIKSKVNYIKDTFNMYNNCIFDMTARNFNQGTYEFPYSNSLYKLKSKVAKSNMSTVKQNIRSTISVKDTGEFYYRVSNGATGIINNFQLDNSDYKFDDLLSSLGDVYTICLHYYADYHPDDNRTILFSGDTSVADSNLGEITNGISIDVHGLYIDNQRVLELEDNIDNDIAIVCYPQQVDGNTEYIVKVYLDGVVSAIRKLSTRIKMGDNLYVGCRRYVKGGNEYLINKCDTNIYSIRIYTEALNEFDLMCQHINNIISTNYVNGAPNYNRIDAELKKNFCSRDADGNVKSLLYNQDAQQYTIDFLLDSNNRLDVNKLTENAKEIGVPIMLIDVSNDSSWSFNSFVKQQSSSSVTLPETENKVVQYWDPIGISQDGSNTDNTVKTIKNATISLQGTSTLKDSVKNLNITLPTGTIFTPKSTWIPEQTYTLKADIVDSSHANNAAIGSFINTELGKKDNPYFPFDPAALKNVYDSQYVKTQQPTATLKHTVEGFPVFVIIKFYTDAQNTLSVTPLGVYSFNIGRDAHRNLGFKQVKSIKNATDHNPVQVTTFPFYADNVEIDETFDQDKSAWIEIKDTNSLVGFERITNSLPEDLDTSKGDFWQNDDNILNQKYEVRFPSGKRTSDYPGFKEFVSNIMKLPIEGCYSSDVNGSNTIPMISGSYDQYTVDSSGNYSKLNRKQQIIVDPNSISDNMGFSVDSAFKYFIICNYFGLVDNFGKNSTYRTWDGSTFYVDFYDLDTANGSDNQGELKIDPDVWIKYITNQATSENATQGMKYVAETFNHDKGLSKTTVSANTNKLWLSLDTPFTKAKWRDGQDTVNSIYAQYWYEFRSFTEALANANGYDTFMNYFTDKYFIKQTELCGSLIFNYDYKLKYMLQFTNNIITNAKDIVKLHGRKVAHNRTWLKKHVVFLDSLFRWRDMSKRQAAMTFKNNTDVTVNATVAGTQVDALPVTSNCPVISRIAVGDTVQAFYFLPNNTKTYVNVGNMQQGGPYTWTINNSNTIIELGDRLTPLYNMKISSIAKSINELNIDPLGLPAIHTIDMHNNKYFSGQFSLDVFRQANVSEVRTINFANTSCAVSGDSFYLDIEQNPGTQNAKTKFTKLTDIDISGSNCITNIFIPTNVPLQNLNITNSNIMDLKLIHQQYLPNLDLTGCNNLRSVYIEDCNTIKELNLSNYANLRSVKITHCENLQRLIINNNLNLEIVDIENCPNLSDVTIVNNVQLVGGRDDNFITLSDLNSLTNVDISNNVNLKTINMSNCNQQNILKLYLNSTVVSNINGGQLLDLSQFSNLKQFDIRNNTGIQEIQFSTNATKPAYITNPFTKCENLLRVYGNIVVKCNACFADLSKFSIHGTTSTINFQGKNVQAIADNTHVVKLPSEIITNNAIPDDNFIMPINVSNKQTNITFQDIDNALAMYRGTACTLFDIYYTLQNLGSLKNLDTMFYFVQNAKFQKTNQADNSPNRYMFKLAKGITSLYDTFTGCWGNSAVLYSPHFVGDSVTVDDGLFSPLVDSLVDISDIWTGPTTGVFDRFLFRHSSKDYKINKSEYFLSSTNSVIVNNTNTLNTSDVFNTATTDNLDESFKANASLYGNLKDFFKNLPNLNYITRFVNANYIDYDTINITTNVSEVAVSFTSKYGHGTIDFTKIFNNPQYVTRINGFLSNEKLNGGVVFNINNDSFKGFINLISIDCIDNNYSQSTFGNGCAKVVNGQFPYDIFKNCPKLQNCCGFFAYTTMPNQINGNHVELPGSLFLNNTKLNNVIGLFRDVKFTYKLTSNGFANCPNLQYANGIFSNSSYSESNQSYIPYKLFYHGGRTISNTYYGIQDGTLTTSSEYRDNKKVIIYNIVRADGSEVKMENTDNVVKWFSKNAGNWTEVVSPEGVLYSKQVVSTEAPNTSILSLHNAFANSRIEPYVNNNPESIHNENYNPFKFVYNGVAISVNTSYDNIDETIMWAYDGVTTKAGKHDGDYEHDSNTILVSIGQGGNVVNGSLNFCCAPDLFRYCNGDCNITSIFNNCGPRWPHYNETGLRGRIPDILLLPFKNFRKDLTNMFNTCSSLTRVSKNSSSSDIYVIPPHFFEYAPNITSLNGTFAYTSVYPNQVFTAFDYISNNTLGNINRVFTMVKAPESTASNPVVFNSVFQKFTNLTDISSAFAQDYVNGPNNGYFKFVSVFPSNRYTSVSQYSSNQRFSNVFKGYGSTFVIHENPKTLIDNNITNNYKTV